MHDNIRFWKCVLVIILNWIHGTQQDCRISTSDVDGIQPLILNERLEFLYPKNGYISLRKSDNIVLACVQPNNFKMSSIQEPFVKITCLESDVFLFERNRVKFSDLLCKVNLKSSAEQTNRICGKNNQEIEIGFDIRVRFIRLMLVCFDKVMMNTLYTHFHLVTAYGKADTSRPSCQSDFFNLSNKKVDEIYSKKNQKKRINGLLKLPIGSDEIINTDVYLARGHLAANADFYFVHERRATYFTLNAAPQWQPFNAGNWYKLENAVRNLGKSKNLDFEIYTGTYRILELSSSNTNIPTMIFLADNIFPVPLFFWKIVYEPNTKSAVAFIGVNNPYIKPNQLKQFEICKKISDKITWVSFPESQMKLGYTYACDPREFLAILDNGLRLQVNDILT